MQTKDCQGCHCEVSETEGVFHRLGFFCSSACLLRYKKVKLLLDLYANRSLEQVEVLGRLVDLTDTPLSDQDRQLFLQEEIDRDLKVHELEQQLLQEQKRHHATEAAQETQITLLDDKVSALIAHQQTLQASLDEQKRELREKEASLEAEIQTLHDRLVEERGDRRRLLRLADFERKERERQMRRSQIVTLSVAASFFVVFSFYWTVQTYPTLFQGSRGKLTSQIDSHAAVARRVSQQNLTRTEQRSEQMPSEQRATSSPSDRFAITYPRRGYRLYAPSLTAAIYGKAAVEVATLTVAVETPDGTRTLLEGGTFQRAGTTWTFYPNGVAIGPPERLAEPIVYDLVFSGYTADQQLVGVDRRKIYRVN